MKKYLNPEYTNEAVMTNDIITTSVWSKDVTQEGANYKQTANYEVNENGEVVGDPTTTIYGDLTTLIGNSNLGI